MGWRAISTLATPPPFLTITPVWVPWPEAVVLWTGIAELLGAAGLIQPWSKQLRRAAGIGLALYALCVWPANMNHFVDGYGARGWRSRSRLSYSPDDRAAADHLAVPMGERSDRLAVPPAQGLKGAAGHAAPIKIR